jgi:hypothetical protein
VPFRPGKTDVDAAVLSTKVVAARRPEKDVCMPSFARNPRDPKRLLTVSLGSLALVSCGLSFDVQEVFGPDDGGPFVGEGGGADAAAIDAEVAPDAPGTDAPVETDAGRADATVDASDAGGCTTILKEDFTVGAGAFTLVGSRTAVENGKLCLLPDDVLALSTFGVAVWNPPADVLDFDATFTVTTGRLEAIYVTADGFAFSWLERPVPGNATFGSGNDLGMTSSPGGQRGFATVLDIYPQALEDRYFALNEIAPNGVRFAAGGGIFGTLEATGPVKLGYRVSRRGSQVTTVIDRSGAAVNGAVMRTTTLGAATTPYRSFVFSTAAGGAHSPGFFLDDVEIRSCP